MSEWQPIETAPKDGTRILGFEQGYLVQTTYWRPSSRHFDFEAGWINPHHGWQPTHWMPLPKPPESV